jgi:hypothetical protein
MAHVQQPRPYYGLGYNMALASRETSLKRFKSFHLRLEAGCGVRALFERERERERERKRDIEGERERKRDREGER